jgi:DNA-binding protein WhiA
MSVGEIARQEILSFNHMDKGKEVGLAFLSGAMRGIGFLRPQAKGFGLVVESLYKELIFLCADITSKFYGVSVNINSFIAGGFNNKTGYAYTLGGEEAKLFLMEAGLLEGGIPALRIPSFVRAKDSCRAAYLRGVYIACGTLSAPTAVDSLSEQTNQGIIKQGYHLELRLTSLSVAQDLLELLCEAGINAGLAERKNYCAIYIKGSENISDFLARIGADKAVMALQEIIISRSVRNLTNRQYNCTIANINKSLRASERQIKAINLIKDKVGLHSLDEQLRQTALIRLEYPYANLEELLAAHDNAISKSGLNHRFRRLAKIADSLMEEEG